MPPPSSDAFIRTSLHVEDKLARATLHAEAFVLSAIGDMMFLTGNQLDAICNVQPRHCTEV